MMIKKKILLIEDDGTLRTLYTDIFEKEGYEVTQAVEGEEGLEKLKEGGYDLTLIDILLPRLEGTKILEKFKNNPPLKPNGPIVMLTNQEQDDTLQKCLTLGAAGVIIKSSITLDELLHKVKTYLKIDIKEED